MPEGQSVLTQFRVFPIFTSVDITVHQYRKNVLYFFYNIAQRTLTEKWREISLLTQSNVDTALSQSAFRIYKCSIINCTSICTCTLARLFDKCTAVCVCNILPAQW